MLPQPNAPKQASTNQDPPDPHVETCRFCGITARPTLGPGRGPHACEASCGSCGKHLYWVSMHSPSERHARRVQERLKAMAKLPPSQLQLAHLLALGDVQDAPTTMLEASQRIDEIVRARTAQP